MLKKCKVGDMVYAKVGSFPLSEVVYCQIMSVSTGFFGTRYVVAWETHWVNKGYKTNNRELIYYWRVVGYKE